jgi:hypothetical protein
MNKILLSLTTLLCFNAIATETHIQPNIFKRAYNYVPQTVKSGTGLVFSGIGASIGTAGTACLALNTKYFIQKALHYSTDWSYKSGAEAPLNFGVSMFCGLCTMYVGAATLYCLCYFGKHFKDIFQANLETKTQQS